MKAFPKGLNDQIIMTEDEFWNLVSYADWPNRDYREVSSEYLHLLSLEEALEFRKIASELKNLLDAFIGTNRNPAGGGDDSHSDLLYHIIGLGRNQFYAHLNDYSLIRARGGAKYGSPEGYEESFCYCMPYHNDYEKKNNIPHFQEWAEVAQKAVDKLVEKEDPCALEMRPYLIKVGFVLEYFKMGKIKSGIKNYECAEECLGKIDLIAKKHEAGMMYGNLPYVSNFFNDFKKYVQ
jgi:hypothetical protein